jgi:hypothetical protein
LWEADAITGMRSRTKSCTIPYRNADFPEEIGETRKRALRTIGKIKVQSIIIQPHPLIGRLLEEDNNRREKQRTSPYSYSWDKPLFEAQWEQRRLRILNALFCALDASGFAPWLRGKDGRDLGVRIGGQSVPLRLERIEPPHSKNKPGRKVADDSLHLDILVSLASEGARNSWSDVEDGRIERQLREIAVEIVVVGEIQYGKSVRAKFLLTRGFEDILVFGLRDAFRFHREVSHIEPPFFVELGIVGISGHAIAHDGYVINRSPRFTSDVLIHEAVANSTSDQTVAELALTFFEKVNDDTGVSRPKGLYGRQ